MALSNFEDFEHPKESTEKALTLRAVNAAHYRRNREYKDTDGWGSASLAYSEDCWTCTRFNRLSKDERNTLISQANVYDKAGYIDTVLEGDTREHFEMLMPEDGMIDFY